MLAMFKKEMRTYFTSMTGYIFLGFFSFITAIFYSLYCVLSQNGEFAGVLSSVTLVFLLLVPTITMRLLAEETKQKTDQLLFTSPVTVRSVVLGKYFSALALLLIAILIIALFPMMLIPFGKVPFAATLGAFVAFFLVGACFIAVGLLISSLTENQIIAAVSTFGALLAMYLMDSIVQGLPTSRIASVIFAVVLVGILCAFIYNNTKSIYLSIGILAVGLVIVGVLYKVLPTAFDGLMVNLFGWFSIMKRFNNFNLGIFDVGSIVYYLSFAAVFVYLTIQVVEKRRWS
jgi:ABC-2 type transport system permease protein